MRVAKMKLPEIELTPEQSEDRTTLQPLFALDQALKDLQDYGIKIGPEGNTSEVEGCRLGKPAWALAASRSCGIDTRSAQSRPRKCARNVATQHSATRKRGMSRTGAGIAALGLGLVLSGPAKAQGPPQEAPGQTETVTVTKTVREPAPRPEPRTTTLTVPGPTETVYSEGETRTETVTVRGPKREVEVANTQTSDVIRAVVAGLAVLLLGFGLWWAFERWRRKGEDDAE